MSDENTKPAAPTAKQKTAPQGTISYNPNLNSWRCVGANGRLVLSTGSLASAKAAFPTFTVQEK